MKRPSLIEYFSKMTEVVSTRSTCRHRRVGCILVSERGHVLATGYNGAPKGLPHCLDLSSCARKAAGKEWEKCRATHAEANALLQCKDIFSIHYAFVSYTPCGMCIKLLMNTSCKIIVYNNIYPNALEHAKISTKWLQSLEERDIVNGGNQ
jgi:dCMP deaminase